MLALRHKQPLNLRLGANRTCPSPDKETGQGLSAPLQTSSAIAIDQRDDLGDLGVRAWDLANKLRYSKADTEAIAKALPSNFQNVDPGASTK